MKNETQRWKPPPLQFLIVPLATSIRGGISVALPHLKFLAQDRLTGCLDDERVFAGGCGVGRSVIKVGAEHFSRGHRAKPVEKAVFAVLQQALDVHVLVRWGQVALGDDNFTLCELGTTI